MSKGIRIRNENGTLTIDSEYKGYGNFYSGTIGLSINTWVTLSFPQAVTSQEPPILAFKKWPYTGFYPAYVQLQGSLGNWTGFNIRCARNTTLFPSGPSNVTFEYRVYACGVSSADSKGLRLRHNGIVTIDTGFLQLSMDVTPVDISGLPIVATASRGFQREHIIALSTYDIGPNDWVPVSLSSKNTFIRNTIIYPDRTVQSVAGAQTGVICLNSDGNVPWDGGSALGVYMYLEDINRYPIQNFKAEFFPFCPIIRDLP